MDGLVRILAALAVLLGGTAFILFVLLSVLRDLLVRQGALGADAPDPEDVGLGTDRYFNEELSSSEAPNRWDALS